MCVCVWGDGGFTSQTVKIVNVGSIGKLIVVLRGLALDALLRNFAGLLNHLDVDVNMACADRSLI